ncbi:MAG: hypothetical protein JNM80_01625 [Phycisphaerae bacterium]|nr:hypothetical protein [Phycisphaerae bacterium]
MNQLIRHGVPLAAMCLAAGSAQAQEIASYSLTFTEVVAGTNTPVASPNGLIEPGEGARLSLTIEFSPPVGSTITYTPPPLPGTGTVAGLASIVVDLLSQPASPGTWNSIGRPAAWTLGDAGSPNINGSEWQDAGAGQFVLPGQTANSTNPVSNIWSGVWSPASYAPRSVTWQSAAGQGSDDHTTILVQHGVGPTGSPLYVSRAIIPGQFGSVIVPIVPAPGVGVVALGGAAWLSRRRRGR